MYCAVECDFVQFINLIWIDPWWKYFSIGRILVPTLETRTCANRFRLAPTALRRELVAPAMGEPNHQRRW